MTLTLFRAMKSADDNLPVLGQSARELGARPNQDIPVDNQGNVQSQSGGMSVTADDVMHLPPHRRPLAFMGTGKDPVFSIQEEQLSPDLIARQFGSQHHYLIEPRENCTFSQYQINLHSTRPHWVKV